MYVHLLPRSAQFYVTYLENANFILQLCFLFGWEPLFVDDFNSYISSTFTMNTYRVQKKIIYRFRCTNLFGDCRNFRAWNWMISKTWHFYKQHFWREWGRDLNAGGMFDRWEPAKGKQKEQWIGLGNCWSTQTWNRFQYFPAHGSGFMATTDYMWHDMYMFSQAACFAVSEYM